MGTKNKPRDQKTPKGNRFEVLDAEVRWSGPVDPSEDSPAVTVSVAASHPAFAPLVRCVEHSDPSAGDQAVRLVAMPLSMLDALAARCVAAEKIASIAMASGAHAPDSRWMRALSRAASRGRTAPAEDRRPSSRAVFSPAAPQRTQELLALDGGALATITRGARAADETRAALVVRRADGRLVEHSFSLPHDAQLALLRPALAPTDRCWIAIRSRDGACLVRCFSSEGAELESFEALCPSRASHISAVGEHRWLHCEGHHVLCAARRDEQRTIAFENQWRPPAIVGSNMFVVEPSSFDAATNRRAQTAAQWVALDAARAPSRFPWKHALHRAVRCGDSLFAATAGGLYFLAPFAEPTLIDDRGPCHAVDARADQVAYVVGQELRILRASTREVVRSLPVDDVVTSVWLSEGCVIVADFTRARAFDAAGKLVWDSGQRREPAVAELSDGTTLVSAGELVAAIDSDGALVGRSSLPYDGQIVGATERYAIFAPISGGVAMTEPDAIYALDRHACWVDKLTRAQVGWVARPALMRDGGGSGSAHGAITAKRVYVISADGAVHEFEPRERAPQLAESKRKPTERGVASVGAHTSNPRDDWPMPGLEVSAAVFLAQDCTYRGTTGASPERGVIARDGAIVTLVRCKLDGDGGGARVRQESTLILCDCVFDPRAIEVEPGSHVLVLRSD